ncbi:MAG: glycerol kinase GlpK [Bacilli bacterium]|nr:glycerol kinase GlpK [Bacilli bacterium]
MKYILAIDQGTTSSRAILFDKKANIVASSQLEISSITNKSGWVEQDPLELVESVRQVIIGVLNKANISAKDIEAVGITNQRETTILWDKKTGKPVNKAIVWQSRQSEKICKEWIKLGYNDKVLEKTGLIINPYFSASKIKWILENTKGLEDKLNKGEILFGTVDTYLIWNLSKGKLHITDYTNASRTMLFNIKELKWDEELLEKFCIPKSILPKVVPSSGNLGKLEILGEEVNLGAIAGDQSAALFGQCCFDLGDVKNTYGTGCFALMNTGSEVITSKNGLLSTIAWHIDGKTTYALEGSVFVAGAAVQWLRDSMKFFKTSAMSYDLALNAKHQEEIFLVPAFTGLGAPYWDNEVRGAIFGITKDTSKEDITSATLDAIAYQVKDVITLMEKEAKIQLHNLKVDGGACENDYLMQFQSNILPATIYRPKIIESTALGVAYMAGLASGYFKSVEEITKLHQIERVFTNKMNEKKRQELYQKWLTAVKAARMFK